MKVNSYRKHAIFAAVLVLGSVALSACGGGGSSNAATAAAASTPAATPPAGITVQGSAQSVAAVDGKVRAILSAPSWTSDGSIASGSYFMGAAIAASGLKEEKPGAYSEISNGTTVATLSSSATIADVAGNGQFAIGRWTNGSDTLGGTYNAKQGRTYAVGSPLQVTMAANATLNCSLVAATRPTSANGNTDIGTLEAATAKITQDASGSPTGQTMDLTLTYSIGSDSHVTFGTTGVFTNAGVMSRFSKSTIVNYLVGADPAKPYLMLSYGIQAPTTGTVNGVAVLSCS
ncbi:hypothetical protein LA345_40390 (plasmid) [Burkholderia vietnamiensis]|uniref:Putative lipoprotein transmembrane n=1 Tax=Burkholderia vietnamiensis (strain G4 / LMG 22486) TaxID=269482 RepID=A4JU33_BURVG|nr:putative lipoprotein transmembrane [Burkholderia vietnamiensis G4]MCB4350054.1 hypothetical protein [Burkholderia vietnamiensis]